FWSW
ncbi:hypothetical protein CP8484711_0141C, partial [Chlamydia psittaci 84-8471/1]